MTVTPSPRLGLTRWGAGTDPLRRSQLDGDNGKLDDLAAIDLQGLAADRPAAGVRGRFYYATDTGRLSRDDGTTWRTLNGPRTVRVPHTWAISGDVKVANGDTDYLLPFFVPVPTGQTVAAHSMRARLNSGTSATVTVERRTAGGTVTALATGVNVTTTPATAALGSALTADDSLALVVTAVSGSPKNMTVTVYLDYTA